VQSELEVSQRRACDVLDQNRAAQRYTPRLADDEGKLIESIHEIIRVHPRYGYRFVHEKLRQSGWRTNRKRVYRLWKREGLKVPQKRVKKRRLGSSANGITRRKASVKNEVWAFDFIFDRTSNGRSIKWLSVIDEFTRECLALEVSRSMGSSEVIDVLSELIAIRGTPVHVRCDNGPEFIAAALRGWLELSGVQTLYIEPASPWQNGYAESFHSRLRDELLDTEVFETLKEAKELSKRWRLDYNHHRPHSSLNYMTPAAFAGTLFPTPAAPGPVSGTAKETSMVTLS
jgi:transposase InsO family protein